MSRLKKGTTVLFTSLIFASLSTSVFADDSSSTPATSPSGNSSVNLIAPLQIEGKAPDTLFSSTSIQFGKKVGGNETYAITDKDQLKQIATERGLSEVPERIEYEYHPNAQATNSLSDKLLGSSVTAASTYWAKTSDQGSGWYYSNNPYKTFYIDGPDTFVYSESKQDTTTWNGSFGMEVSVLKAEVGFSSGEQRTVQFTSNTPVKEKERLTAKLFVTYHKVWYSVYYGIKNDPTSLCYGTGYAWEANGTLIEKTFSPRN